MTTILIKKKDTAGAPAPGDLTNAAGGTEIAVNTATRRIYTKDAGGAVVELGTNASSSTIADLTVTNSTTLSYGTANQVQFLNASKLLVGSGNMTFNGTRLTVADLADSGLTATRVVYSTTGGALVDSANLTFDGTNLTLGGGTANGVAYLNGSKVLTTGSALNFDGSGTLNVINSGGTGFSTQDAASNFSILRLGTDTANGYAFFQSGRGGTGTTLPFAWRQDSSELMRLNSTGLGIGTSSPDTRLTVAKTSNADFSSQAALRASSLQTFSNGALTTAVVFNGTTGNPDKFISVDNAGGTQFFSLGYLNGSTQRNVIQFDQNDTIYLNTAGNERVRVTSAGYVGIRTSSPQGFLHVAPGSAASSGAGAPIILQAQQGSSGNTGGNVLIGSGQNGPGSSNGYIAFGIGSATSGSAFSAGEAVRITETGLVGIGTSSPLTTLHAVGNLTLGAQNSVTQRIVATPDASVINTGTGSLVVKAGQANSNTGGGSAGSLTLSGGDSNRTGSSNGTAGATLVRGGDVLDGGVGSVEGAGGAGTLTLRGGDNVVGGSSSSSAGDLAIRGGNLSLKAASNGSPGSVTIATGSLTLNGQGWGGSAPFIAFQTGTTSVTERARITSAGNLCVGSTSAGNAGSINVSVGNPGVTAGGLQLWSPNNTTHYVQFGDGTSGADPYSGAVGYSHVSDAMLFLASGSERARIDSTGLLVNTTTSSGRNITVGGTSASISLAGTNGGIYFGAAGTPAGSGGFGSNGAIARASEPNFHISGSVAGDFCISTENTKSILFGTGNVERARIDSSGNFFINTTSTDGRLGVSTSGSHGVTSNVTSSGSGFSSFRARTDASDTNRYYFWGSTGGADRVFIFGNGNIQNTNNSYGVISDVKLKENIVDATPKLEKLQQVRIVNYNLKTDPDLKQIGVIAQELEQIFPGMVDEIIDRDQEGNDLGTTTKSVKMSVFVPMLIKAMQEQQAIINQLKARLDAANL